MASQEKKIRYAVIGLGYFAQAAVLPAFRNASQNCELAALISDDQQKAAELAQKYGVQHTYTNEQFDECMRSGNVDALYIVLPNNLHRDYTIRAANAGIHVLCEKPMSITEEDCLEMIDAAERNGVKLMIAYRLHLEEANLKAIEVINSGKIGVPKLFHSTFTFQVSSDNIRTQAELGGGPLYDIGVYCINAARYIFKEEPLEITAFTENSGDERFREVEESAAAILRFQDGKLATFSVSFAAAGGDYFQVVGSKGELCVDSAYEWQEDIVHYLTINGETQEVRFRKRDQVAAELIYFSQCVLENKEPEPSGCEGLADVRIVRAIMESARTHRAVKLEPFARKQRPSLQQEIRRPAQKEPDLVHAASPCDEC